MMNTYELEVRAACPVQTGETDLYQVTIESAAMIEVERIVAFFARYAKRKIFQEELARRAATALGARVRIVGVHSGVKVTATAP